MSQNEQVCSEQSICFLPALGTVPPSSMVYVTVLLQPLLPHYSFLLSADTAPSPLSSYWFLDPLLLHHLILNIRNPVPPLQSRSMSIHPFALSSWIPGWGQESLWLQRRHSTFHETAFLPFMLAGGMICVGKIGGVWEEWLYQHPQAVNNHQDDGDWASAGNHKSRKEPNMQP